MGFISNCRTLSSFSFQNIERPIVMGILNLTPDSFYDGGLYKNKSTILHKVGTMLQEGASIIDVGAYSSRPNAKHISFVEEQKRLIPILKSIVKEYPKAIISIDTFRSEIAKNSIHEGAHIINDISGGNMDSNMFKTIAELNVPYILMHMQGIPQTMQNNPNYTDVTSEILFFFQNKLKELEQAGVKNVVLDVGFGFGKTLEQNYQLLQKLTEFKVLDKPLLVGLSRKSMLHKVLKTTPEEALNATTIVHTIAILNGANILRVHDVKEAVEVLSLINQYQK